jgi:hypothetical protein
MAEVVPTDMLAAVGPRARQGVREDTMTVPAADGDEEVDRSSETVVTGVTAAIGIGIGSAGPDCLGSTTPAATS